MLPVYALNLGMTVLAIGVCLLHARRDRGRLAFLAVASVYGLLLEQLVIIRFERYNYPVEEFIVTLGDVPVVIGLGWAAIIYVGYQTALAFDVPERVVPPLVGLYALHIDLAVDAVAIRVGFWNWTPPGVWFGVPLGNFLGWFCVATFFAAGWLYFEERYEPLRAGVLALVSAVVLLSVTLELWWRFVFDGPVLLRAAVLLAVLAPALVMVVRADPSGVTPGSLAVVPVLFHGFYLLVLVDGGWYLDRPVLLVVSLAMLALGLALHHRTLVSSRLGSATRTSPTK